MVSGACLSEKSTDPIHQGFPPSDLTPTSQRRSLQIPSHRGLGFNMSLGGGGGRSIQSVATLKDVFIKVWRSSFYILEALFRLCFISSRSQNFQTLQDP